MEPSLYLTLLINQPAVCPGAQPNSPASLAEGGGGKGAGGGLGNQPQRKNKRINENQGRQSALGSQPFKGALKFVKYKLKDLSHC